MSQRNYRCCILGGREADLGILGELHKQPEVEIRFVYDRDPSSVGMEIAEILGLRRINDPIALDDALEGLTHVVVNEPRERFLDEIARLSAAGARLMGPQEALSVMVGESAVVRDAADVTDESYSLEDALGAFERLFDRKKLLEFLLDVAVRAVGANAGSIMLFSDVSAELYIAYATGLSERVVRGARQKLGEGIAGVVAQERRGRVIDTPQGATLYSGDRDRLNIRSAISVPLLWGDELLGVLNVSSDSKKHRLEQAGLITLERMSGRVARLLHESLKLHEAQIRHQELDLRQSVGELSERPITASAKFSLLAELLAELVGAATVEIYVATLQGNWFALGGSTRRQGLSGAMVQCERGALSRTFLENRTIVFTENASDSTGDAESISSLAFVPLSLTSPLGVLVLEFDRRFQLEEFRAVKDSVALELSRFVASEKRERRLRRELSALGMVSDAAPMLLTCRTADDLGEFLARLVADVLGSKRVSVRLQGPGQSNGRVARLDRSSDRSPAWEDEDEDRFLTLKKKGEAYSIALMGFGDVGAGDEQVSHSLLAVPVVLEKKICGGIISYDKEPGDPLDEAAFTDLDQTVVEHIVAIAEPVLRSLSTSPGEFIHAEAPSYDTVLSGNVARLKKVLDGEMARSDRYHYSFSLLVIRVTPLERLFEDDAERALRLIDEITRGVQTRTRKTDFACWTRRDTFAMLSLEGSKRVKFLISRLVLYLVKDFSTVADMPIAASDVLVGRSVYPGTSRTPEALIEEAQSAFDPFSDDA